MPAHSNPFIDAVLTADGPNGSFVPIFGGGNGEETTLNSSPFVLTLGEFLCRYGKSEKRAALASGFSRLIDSLRSIGCDPVAALLGGSFIRAVESPNDIDCLLFYTIRQGANVEVVVEDMVALASAGNSDVKFCPADTGLLTVLKRAIFFSNMFAYDRDSGVLLFGSILVDVSEGEGRDG